MRYQIFHALPDISTLQAQVLTGEHYENEGIEKLR
jgi:hypothetical protein